MKTAFITGASTGIGKVTAIILAERGYRVFLASRNIKALNGVKDIITRAGGEATVVQLDLLSLNSIKLAANLVKNSTKELNVLANIAGMYHDDKQHFFDIPFEEYPDHAIIKNINASLVGHILLTKYFVPIMSPGSCVINMSGTFGNGETGVISDYVTKNAIEVFSRQLATELKDKEVRSNCIRPGFVYTENVRKLFPEVKPEDALDPKFVAEKIVSVCEDNNLNGEVIEITKKNNNGRE